MNAFVRKEVRLILPAWLIAMVAALSPWFNPTGADDAPLFIAGLGIVPLALASFAQEINLGTFGLLLAQPERRHRIWRVKTALTLVAMLAVLFVFMQSVLIRGSPNGVSGFRRLPHHEFAARDITVLVGAWPAAFGLALFAGGLWTTLLFRHAMVAFCLTFLIPLGLVTSIAYRLPNAAPSVLYSYQECALAIYAVAGFLWARWQFMRAQDTQWTGGTVSLHMGAGNVFSAFSPMSFRLGSPMLATLKKEVQLQQPAILVAAVVMLVHLTAVILRKITPGLTGRYPALTGVWILWFFVPLLAGCLAVAEERRLNTLEGSQSLPVSKLSRFLAKFAVVLAVSILAGVGGPLLVERFGTWIGTPWANGERDLWSLRYGVSLGVLITAGVSFYASTLTRNGLQALGATLLFAFGVMFAFGLCFDFAEKLIPRNYHVDAPYLFLMWPVPTIILLAYLNFNRLQISGRLWIRDALILAAVFLIPLAADVLFWNSFRL